MIWLIYLLYGLFGMTLFFCGITIREHPVQSLLLIVLFVLNNIISRLLGYKEGTESEVR